MAYPVSLGDLIRRARQMANLDGATAFITDQIATDFTNESIAEWVDMVRMGTFSGQYFRSPFPITVVANTTLYPLPADCASIISVDALVNGNSYAINALGYQEEQRNLYRMLPFVGWNLGIASVWYQKQGTSINFLPQPPAGTSIVINYCPVAPRLSSMESDYLDSIQGWESWIVIDVAIKMLIRFGAEDMLPVLQGRLEQQADRIRSMSAQADANNAEGVHETQAYGFWGAGGWGF